MEQEFKRETAGYYVSDTGEKIAIKPVNREYPGRTKKPCYFMSKYNRSTKKYIYMSGLFRTKEPGVFSWDLKDEFGIKVLQAALFSEGGETITLLSMDEYKRGIAA